MEDTDSDADADNFFIESNIMRGIAICIDFHMAMPFIVFSSDERRTLSSCNMALCS